MASIRDVGSSGICVGCGACSVATQGAVALGLNEYGYFSVNFNGASPDDLARASAVCPFANEADNETRIGRDLYAQGDTRHDVRIGYYNGLFAGRVNVDDDKIRSFSSGGLTSWVNAALLASGEVDGVIHVSENPGGQGSLFEYVISESLDQLYSRTKSRYHAVCFADVVAAIRGNGKRYAFVGVPCFVKAIRLLCRQDAVLFSQVAYAFALVCGHMKSAGFAELLAWQADVAPDDLDRIDFRVKDPEKTANHYAIQAQSLSGEVRTATSASLYGSNWGHAFFQLKACDYCDDVMGELADASFGDAWLPKYESNWRGTNVVVCRNETVKQLLLKGRDSGALFLDDLNESEVVRSQAGNYRHRWDGLSVRLQDAQKKNEWVPQKRIQPGERKVSMLRVAVVRLRQQLAAKSHIAFLEAKKRRDLGHFNSVMQPLTKRMSLYNTLARLNNRDFVFNKLLNPSFYLRKLGLRGRSRPAAGGQA